MPSTDFEQLQSLYINTIATHIQRASLEAYSPFGENDRERKIYTFAINFADLAQRHQIVDQMLATKGVNAETALLFRARQVHHWEDEESYIQFNKIAMETENNQVKSYILGRACLLTGNFSYALDLATDPEIGAEEQLQSLQNIGLFVLNKTLDKEHPALGQIGDKIASIIGGINNSPADKGSKRKSFFPRSHTTQQTQSAILKLALETQEIIDRGRGFANPTETQPATKGAMEKISQSSSIATIYEEYGLDAAIEEQFHRNRRIKAYTRDNALDTITSELAKHNHPDTAKITQATLNELDRTISESERSTRAFSYQSAVRPIIEMLGRKFDFDALEQWAKKIPPSIHHEREIAPLFGAVSAAKHIAEADISLDFELFTKILDFCDRHTTETTKDFIESVTYTKMLKIFAKNGMVDDLYTLLDRYQLKTFNVSEYQVQELKIEALFNNNEAERILLILKHKLESGNTLAEEYEIALRMLKKLVQNS